MFDFRNACPSQRAAIATVDGPVLVTGGPGTGKTWALVQRAAYMVEERGIAPQSILVLTRTNRHAAQLRVQIGSAFSERGIDWASPRLDLQTFAAYAERILLAAPEYPATLSGGRILDRTAQQFAVYLRYPFLRRAAAGMQRIEDDVPEWELEGSDERWVYSGAVCDFVNRLTESLTDIEALASSDDPDARAGAAIVAEYRKMLARENLTDESIVKAEAYRALRESQDALARTRALTKYIMVDDYQETTHVEGQTAALVAGPDGNICAFADEDQALERSRGGRSIFGFTTLIPEHPCQTIVLDVNFRSRDDIIRFDDAFMQSVAGEGGWGGFRKPRVVHGTGKSLRSPAVVRLEADSSDRWHEDILRFLQEFCAARSGRNLTQVTMLCRDIRSSGISALGTFLEAHGMCVWAPRTDLFFARREIQQAIGVLLIAAEKDAQDLTIKEGIASYYEVCREQAMKTAGGTLAAWARGNTGRSLPSVLAGALLEPPFDTWTASKPGTMSAEVCALMTLAGALEGAMRLPPFFGRTSRNRMFFEEYLPVLIRNGIQDPAYLLPDGCVSIRTIGEVRGMGLPLVIVIAQSARDEDTSGDLADAIERKYSPDPPVEPQDRIDLFDLWRTYYTSFSRAEGLLVITGFGPQSKGSLLENRIVEKLPPVGAQQFNLAEFTFRVPEAHGAPLSQASSDAGSVPLREANKKRAVRVSVPAPPKDSSPQKPKSKKSTPPAGKTRRFLRSLSVSMAGHNNVHNQPADNQDGDDKADHE